MLKSEAEQMIRRVLEDNPGYEMTEEQIAVMAQIIVKIAGRMIEEAVSTMRSGQPGKPSQFFS
jgi:hypothetical protein